MKFSQSSNQGAKVNSNAKSVTRELTSANAPINLSIVLEHSSGKWNVHQVHVVFWVLTQCANSVQCIPPTTNADDTNAAIITINVYRWKAWAMLLPRQMLQPRHHSF